MTYDLTIKKALRVSALINLLYNSQQTLLPAGQTKNLPYMYTLAKQ